MVARHDEPNLARLGRCGCVCCNNCVRQIEEHQSNKKESYVHCPYCGNPECYSKNLRIWLVSKEVKEAYERAVVNESLKAATGKEDDFNITGVGDALKIELG